MSAECAKHLWCQYHFQTSITMNTLIATLALAHHILFMGCCVVAIIMLVGMTMDAVNNLKNNEL